MVRCLQILAKMSSRSPAPINFHYTPAAISLIFLMSRYFQHKFQCKRPSCQDEVFIYLSTETVFIDFTYKCYRSLRLLTSHCLLVFIKMSTYLLRSFVNGMFNIEFLDFRNKRIFLRGHMPDLARACAVFS